MPLRSVSFFFSLPAAVALVAACSAGAGGNAGGQEETAARTRSRRDAVVYGPDDRKDVYDHPDMRMRTIANLASVVLAWPPYIDESDPTKIGPSAQAPTLGVYKNLCPTEPFRSDPAMGSCSGALIDDDLVLTAGHCVPTPEDCTDARLVFNWQKTSATTLHTITKDDVFRCTERLVFKYETTADGAVHDYAIVKLNRSAVPRFRPTAVRHDATTKLSSNTTIGIIGYGSGIPAKIDTGATLLDPGGSKIDFFVHTSDAYSGNSGSPVFDLSSYEIAGILARGTADDFVDTGTCSVNHVCPGNGGTANGCTGMSSDYAPKSVAELCANPMHASSHPKLCAPTPCGNGRCEANETTTSCPFDCPAEADAGADAGAAPPTSNDNKDPNEDASVSPTTSSKTPVREARPPENASSGCGMTRNGDTQGGWLGPILAMLVFVRRRQRRPRPR